MTSTTGTASSSLPRTLGGGLVVLLTTALVGTIALQAAAVLSGADLESSDPVPRRDGLLVGCRVLFGALAGAAVLALVVRPSPRAMLALDRPALRELAIWTLAAVALVAAFDLAAVATGRPLVEPGWRDAWRTAPAALLLVALVTTSVFEELYFRGFLQTGLSRTRLGPTGTIVLLALLFAAAHVPDDVWRFADVFLSGLLLGIARQRSGSSLTTMPAHVLGNLKVLLYLALAS